MNIRKNQAQLTHAERVAFVNAVLALKQRPSRLNPPTASRYDDYVWTHLQSMMAMTTTAPGWAHMGPAFLPWHRYLIRQFELDLQMIDLNVTLPYWDWTVDRSTAPQAPGNPWTDDFMGGSGDPNNAYHVTTGPFAGAQGHWPLTLFDTLDPTNREPQDPFLRRDFGTIAGAEQLPTADAVAGCMQEMPYYVAPWMAFGDMGNMADPTRPSFCNRLEGWYGRGSIHNRVHLWVGGQASGSMVWMSSPNDPVFFLHHCNIDRLWAQWQREHPDQGYHPTGQGNELGPQGHNLNDSMQPWGGTVTPASVLDHHALGYAYDTEPIPLVELAGRLLERSAALGRISVAVRFPRRRFDLSAEDKQGM
jgi:tyrosinase